MRYIDTECIYVQNASVFGWLRADLNTFYKSCSCASSVYVFAVLFCILTSTCLPLSTSPPTLCVYVQSTQCKYLPDSLNVRWCVERNEIFNARIAILALKTKPIAIEHIAFTEMRWLKASRKQRQRKNEKQWQHQRQQQQQQHQWR